MIEHTKKLVEDRFNLKNGYQYDAEVNYLYLCGMILTRTCEEFVKDSATNVGGLWGYRFCDGTVWCS